MKADIKGYEIDGDVQISVKSKTRNSHHSTSLLYLYSVCIEEWICNSFITEFLTVEDESCLEHRVLEDKFLCSFGIIV